MKKWNLVFIDLESGTAVGSKRRNSTKCGGVEEGGEAGHDPVGGGNEEQTFLADDAGDIKFSGLQGELADLMAELKDV